MSGPFDNAIHPAQAREQGVDHGPEGALAKDGPRATLVLANPLPAASLKDVRLALSPEGDSFRIETTGDSRLGPFSGRILLTVPKDGPARLGTRWPSTLIGLARTRSSSRSGWLTVSIMPMGKPFAPAPLAGAGAAATGAAPPAPLPGVTVAAWPSLAATAFSTTSAATAAVINATPGSAASACRGK